jgi:hypothetical protein
MTLSMVSRDSSLTSGVMSRPSSPSSMGGLTKGMCCVFFLLWVQSERTRDGSKQKWFYLACLLKNCILNTIFWPKSESGTDLAIRAHAFAFCMSWTLKLQSWLELKRKKKLTLVLQATTW